MNPAQGFLDGEKILSLLQEYIRTLQEACRREADRRYRFTLLRIASGTVLALVALFVGYVSNDHVWNSFPVIAAGGAAVGAAVALVAAFRAGKSYTPDAAVIGDTVKRLVQTASQYNEHASHLLGHKFEFELRLAEADAVLGMYGKLFPNAFTGFRPESPRPAETGTRTAADEAIRLSSQH